MDPLPTRYGETSRSSDSHQHDIPNTRTDHNLTNNIHGDSNTNVGNVSNSYNTINVGVSEESLLIQAWLSPLAPHRRHQDVSSGRLDGVGNWVLHTNEFESWRGSQDGSGDPTLLCQGGQGVGKTYISSLVIDSLRDQTCGQNMAVVSLYCDYQAQKDQSAANIIGSLLSQVALRTMRTRVDIQSVFELKERGDRALRLPDMLKLFAKTVNSIERVYICLDAVDELLPQSRAELLRALRQIIQDAPNIRLFLTGRPHIRGELDKHLTKGSYILRIVADQGDIARYVSQMMDIDDDRDPDLMTDDLKHGILNTMLEKASEMFLLVVLNMDAILSETTLAKRKKMLQKVSTTGVDLSSVYAQTLQRIKEQKGDRSRLGMEVLMWISHVERPLSIGELCHALAVEIGSVDLNPENLCPQDTVLGSCLGLAMVDTETSTVRLIHYTLQEYLCLPGVLPNAHQTLGQTCLTYLNYEQVKGLPTDEIPRLRDMPFLEYSSLYWGIHAKRNLLDGAESLAIELLSRYDGHVSSTLLFDRIQGYRDHWESIGSPFTGLHCASYFGIAEVVGALIKMQGCDINQTDGLGFTPLTWAAERGNEAVARLLLECHDVSPDKPDNEGRTPLSQASSGGHEGVVGLLLVRDDVNLDKPDDQGRTPVWWASSGGHVGVVRLLLARSYVNPDEPDIGGRTPLTQASLGGYEGVVKLLLTKDNVNPDKPDNAGRTQLWWACFGEQEGAVMLLLARGDVNPNRLDNEGRTQLWWASSYGKKGVVRLLLARDDVDPNKPDAYGRTPLSVACFGGHEEVVRLLLARRDLTPDMPDSRSQTPLFQACCSGSEGAVKLMLERHDINPDKPDNEGQTPLSRASSSNYMGIVRLLLARNDVNPDKPDNCGRVPLMWACFSGSEGVVRLLLERHDVNLNKPDNDGRTPVWWASSRGHEGVMRLLLARGDVQADKPDNEGETPLFGASRNGYEGVVILLLARGDVEVDKLDNEGQTPLSAASLQGREGVAKLLLARDDVNPDMPDNNGRTPLSWACYCGSEGVVRLLLERHDVNPDKPDNTGQTPLSQAAGTASDGHDQIMIEFCSTMICSISLNHWVPRSQS